MSAKRRADGAGDVVEMDPLEPDMERAAQPFDLKTLLEEAGTKMAEASKRKIGLNERIQKNREAIARIETLIRNLELKGQQESGIVFSSAVLRPIQAEIQAIFPHANVELTGPYGLANCTTITVSKRNVNAIGKLKGENSKSITFIPMPDNKLGIRNLDEDTGEFPKGSIGWQQGMNHPAIPVPEENPIAFVLEWLR
jgi:hypothetical protein